MRMYFVHVMVLMAFIYVAFKLHQVQIERHDELLGKAQETYTTKVAVHGDRGEIYDYTGNLFAANSPTVRIICDPSNLNGNEKTVADFLAENWEGLDAELLLQDLLNKENIKEMKDGTLKRTKRQYMVLIDGINYTMGKELLEKRDMITAKLTEMKKKTHDSKEKARLSSVIAGYNAIKYQVTSKRYYPKNSMFSNMLGYVDKDGDSLVPKMGLERYLEEELIATNGSKTYERTIAGKPLETSNGQYTAPQNGANVYLTIREPLQAIVEEEIDELMERTAPKTAIVVMVDPFSGDILAAAQRPTFDPNNRAAMGKDSQRGVTNWLTGFTFEPGSIMKSITMAYALDRGFVKPTTIIDCEQRSWYYAGHTLHDTHTTGVVEAGEIIKQSSNIGTAKIAVDMGRDHLYNAMWMFGFGQKTNIQQTYENKGLLPKKERWSKLSVARICFGQGLTVTPLQMVRAYCMLANGGHRLDLRLIDHIQKDGIVTKMPVNYDEKSSFINPNTQKDITDMLRSVTEPGGTGKAAAVTGYYVAGKTGTAQKAENGHYSSSKYYSSFCGYVPAYSPKFVLLVMADEPTKGSNLNGGPIAGPTFKTIAERSLRYLAVKNDLSEEEWLAERKELQKIQTAKIRKEDERVAAQRLKNAAAAAASSAKPTSAKTTSTKTTTSSKATTSTKTTKPKTATSSSTYASAPRTTTSGTVRR